MVMAGQLVGQVLPSRKNVFPSPLWIFQGWKLYLGASRTSKSATFPFSIDPWVFERPMLWAELIVEATNASAKLIRKFTAAKCITAG